MYDKGLYIMDISNLRQDYHQNKLSKQDAANCPFEQFDLWFNDCIEKKILEPYAMALATTDENNNPHVRIVLMRRFDKSGLCFYTNYESAKGKQIKNNAFCEVLFFWQGLERQVRINGYIEKLSYQENQEYFLKRPIESQIGAIISPQSQVIHNREFLQTKYDDFKKMHNQPYQCPEYWGGYKIIPQYFEFWQGRSSRLHDRIIYTQQETQWKIERLAP